MINNMVKTTQNIGKVSKLDTQSVVAIIIIISLMVVS